MPKKKTETEKTSDKKDEILKEIADKLREIEDKELSDKEKTEKSELEEDVGLDALQFQQFMQPSEETPAPVLERIAGSQPRPIFVGGMAQAPSAAPGEEKTDEFKYVPGHEGNNEPKYTGSEARIFREPERVDFARVGRDPAEIIPKADQEAFFRRSESFSQIESPSTERTWGAERIDTQKAGRKEPFEAEQEKYEKYKPKVPKSY